jgi:hypothetical protein
MGDAGTPEGLSEREQEIYRLRVVNRWTVSKIGEKFDLSHQRVSQILADMKDRMPPIDIEGVRRQSLQLQEDIQRRMYELAELAGAPVTAGKDGELVLDPSSGEYVRDYSGRIAALKLAQEADKEIRKLLGADAAQKVESTATVKYVIEGVDPGALA